MTRSEKGLTSVTPTMPSHGRYVNVFSNATQVFAAGHCFKMIWTNAARIAAEMIYLKSRWDWPIFLFICPAVCENVISARSRWMEYPPRSIFGSTRPIPAGIGLVNLFPKPFCFGTLREKFETAIFEPAHVVITTPSASAWFGSWASIYSALHMGIISHVESAVEH